MILLDKYAEEENHVLLILLIPLFISGLLMFEAQLGLLAIWPIILFFRYRDSISREKILGMAIYYISIGAYLIWKVFIQSTGFIEKKQDYLFIGFKEIFYRYFSAMRTVLGGFRYNIWDSTWISWGNVFIVIAITILLLILAIMAMRSYDQKSFSSSVGNIIRENINIFVLGILLAAAGYFPIILNYPPNIYGVLSRVNMFSTPGIVLILLSIIHSAGFGIFGGYRTAVRFTVMVSLFLMLWGSIIHLQVQDAYIHSWGETKLFYQQLFLKVPDLDEDTQIILLLDGYDDDGQKYRPLFSSSWEPGCAFRTLYNKEGVRVFYRYNDITVPSFPAMNILTNTMFTDTIPQIGRFDDFLVLNYDRSSQTLMIKEKIDGLFGTEPVSDYSPFDQILPLDKEIMGRKLVEN